jgi:K+/H+ antiporter YhaU regulatory subunit KhtT
MFKVRLLPLSHTQTARIICHQKQSRKLFSTTTSTMSAIIDAIKKDHREIEEYYQHILNASDNDTATRWQNQFVWELARHSIAEELVVYPAFEKNLGDKGHQMAEKDRAEHQTVRACEPSQSSVFQKST